MFILDISSTDFTSYYRFLFGFIGDTFSTVQRYDPLSNEIFMVERLPSYPGQNVGLLRDTFYSISFTVVSYTAFKNVFFDEKFFCHV